VAHDIFISYATRDKEIADAVCGAVETSGFRCWIAPRDVLAGMPYGEAIIDAIQASRAMVVVFSSSANASTHIPKEVERATTHGVPIIPLRIEDVLPTKSLDYFLASLHWLDAVTPPLEAHFRQLTEVITQTLSKDGAGKTPSAGATLSAQASSTSGRAHSDFKGDTKAKNLSWWSATTVIAIVAAVVLLAGAGWYYRSRMTGGETIDSLAVLPFVNGSNDPNMEYLSDGITESLINSLSQLPQLKVMSRDSAFHYKGKDTSAEAIGRELGVRAIFKGRIAQQGENLDVSAELIDTRDNSHIWGQQYDRKLADVIALREEIAKEITTALRTRLSGDQTTQLAKSYTTNPDAYQDYLQGRFWWGKKNSAALTKAINFFQEAIEKDPNYAAAYSGLADSYTTQANYGFAPPAEALSKARDAARKALEIDDTLGEAHASLAFILAQFECNWDGAEAEFQRAFQLNPGYASGHDMRASILRDAGRVDEGIAESKRAVALDPLSLSVNRNLGYGLYAARKYDLAIEQERKTLELDPNYGPAHSVLGRAYLEKGMYNEAISEIEKAANGGITITDLGLVYARAGRKDEAEQALEKVAVRSKTMYFLPKNVAAVYGALGEKDKAFEWLEKSYQDRSICVAFGLKALPVFDPLRSDPRFADFLRRINLTP